MTISKQLIPKHLFQFWNFLFRNNTINSEMSYGTPCSVTMSHQEKYILEHPVPKLTQHIT